MSDDMTVSWCLGLIVNGQQKSAQRLLLLVPHERSHGIMRTLANLCMLLPKVLKMRAMKDTMALVADSIGGNKMCICANVVAPWASQSCLLNWQGMSTHPKMENGPELFVTGRATHSRALC